MSKPAAPPTLHDVAERASVAVSTVSKVLNGYTDVSKATRVKVLRAVEELGFRPNRAARSFRTGRTRTVSVFVPMIGTEFYDRLITAIDHELAERDYDAALFPLLNEQRLERYRSPDALPYQTDGLILASLNPDWLFEKGRLPVPQAAVLVDAYHPDYDTITVDNFGGAREATDHLLLKPAPTFAVLVEDFREGTFSSGVFIERHKGFSRALAERGLEPRPDTVVEAEFSEAGGRDALARILQAAAPPVNIFASCDLLARGIISDALNRGLTPGDDVRVIGFDDQPWTAQLDLSTVRQPIEEMGKLAAQLVLERLEDPTRPAVHRELQPELLARGSTKGRHHT